jgi:GTPase
MARSILVCLNIYNSSVACSNIAELNGLALALMLEPSLVIKKNIRQINRSNLIGKDLLSYLKIFVAENKDSVIIFNVDLLPIQQRNIEQHTCAKVIDNSELILNIFAARAMSFEGKLQVELAQLKHQSSRLVRTWTHLERQKGGIGLRAGPGEKQLESDRRIIRAKIAKIEQKLKKVVKTRTQNRQKRAQNKMPIVALVGYTNAGKSTVFNALSKKNTLVKDMLFASLDTVSANVYLAENKHCIVIDTVGFISNLPVELLNAFKSTLEEIIYADLIVHVVDYADKEHEEHLITVNKILAEIGADSVPQIIAYNKIDLIPDNNIVLTKNDIAISASTGDFATLTEMLCNKLH